MIKTLSAVLTFHTWEPAYRRGSPLKKLRGLGELIFKIAGQKGDKKETFWVVFQVRFNLERLIKEQKIGEGNGEEMESNESSFLFKIEIWALDTSKKKTGIKQEFWFTFLS